MNDSIKMNHGVRRFMKTGDMFEIRCKTLDTEVAPHWHDYIEFEFLSGSGMVEYSVNGRSYILQNGSAFLATPEDIHEIKVIRDIRIYSISLNEIYISPQLLALLRRPQTGKVAHFPTGQSAQLTGMLDLMMAEYDGDSPVRRELLLSLMSAVLYMYVQYAREEDNVAGKADLLASNIATIIRASFRKRITVGHIAGMLHLTPNYIGERFKKEMGKSITEYIMETRLSNAYNLIRSGSCNITEAAERSGFGSVAYFSAAFKKHYGYPPSNLTRDVRRDAGKMLGKQDT